jgi:hypothetical protein
MSTSLILRLAILAAGTAALTACGGVAGVVYGHSSATAAAEPGVDTYLCQGSTEDDLLQWRDSGGYLSGTYQQAQIAGQAPSEQVSSSTGSLSGTLNGTAITLDINGPQDLYGTLSGGQLSLNVPQSGGSIQTATCGQSSVDDWNKAVSALNGQAASDNQAANQAQASASQAQAQAAQESSAQGDVSMLRQDTSLSGDVSQIAGDVKSTDGDVAQTRADAANGNGDNCTNASSTVYNDAASTVYNDVLSTAYNDVLRAGDDISTLRKDISTVQGDQSALANAGLPGTPGADAAVSAAQAAISSAIYTVNGYVDHLNGDLSTSYAVADAVGTGACAGDGPGQAPAGLDHLT